LDIKDCLVLEQLLLVYLPGLSASIIKQKMMSLDEEMNALRRVGVPEWSKNSTLLVTGKNEKGYPKYIDFSYSNAYDSFN
jgi:hypothetical protein